MSVDFLRPEQFQAVLNVFQFQNLPIDDRFFEDEGADSFLRYQNSLNPVIPATVEPESDSGSSLSRAPSPHSDTADEIESAYFEGKESFMAERRIKRQERHETKARKSTSDTLQPISPPVSELDEDDLKRKRLARKAELARVSRKRKKDRIEELEAQVQGLQAELLSERQSKKINSEAQLEYKLTSSIAAIVHGNASTPQIAHSLVSNFFSLFCKQKAAAVLQIESIQAVASPCLPSRFLQWVFSQSDKFYQDPAGLYTSLFSQELGATPQQLEQLTTLRYFYTSTLSTAASSTGRSPVDSLAAVLRAQIEQGMVTMERFMQIFSAQQLVLFFKWVERFGPICIKINV